MDKILLIQLGANGDCLYATTVARQIKQDYPECCLTWAIAEKYVSVLLNNPHVDEVWPVQQLPGESLSVETWYRVRLEAERSGKYIHIFSTQIYPGNVSNFDGVIRSSTFRNYPHPIKVPVDPVIHLLPEEIERADAFAARISCGHFRHVVLFESSPGSGQSCLNLEKSVHISEKLLARHEDMIIIMSTHQNLVQTNPRLVSARELSFRENLALAKYCTFLIGGSSGISWLLTALKEKKIPTVQFINCRDGFFASMVYDLEYWGQSVDHILETGVEDEDLMAGIVSEAVTSFTDARQTHHIRFRPRFWNWIKFVDYRRGFSGLCRFWRPLTLYIRRNGFYFSDILDVAPIGDAVRHVFRELCQRQKP